MNKEMLLPAPNSKDLAPPKKIKLEKYISKKK
jgi:hypothetical protein